MSDPAPHPAVAVPVPYQALWERAGDALACRVAIAAVRLGADEYAGMVAGTVGAGLALWEPFHVRFVEEQAVHLALGDERAVPRGRCPFEGWPAPARQAAASARLRLRPLLVETAEGFWTPADRARGDLRWLAHAPGLARSGCGAVDERVWSAVSAHSGVAAGLDD